jgi:hypothetical protein
MQPPIRARFADNLSPDLASGTAPSQINDVTLIQKISSAKFSAERRGQHFLVRYTQQAL